MLDVLIEGFILTPLAVLLLLGLVLSVWWALVTALERGSSLAVRVAALVWLWLLVGAFASVLVLARQN